jgi:hypothetical protein
VVRTADADRISGVKDPAPVAGKSPATSTAPVRSARRDEDGGTSPWIAVGIPCGAAVLLGIRFGVWRLRQRRTPPTGDDRSRDELAPAGAHRKQD